MKTAKVTEIVKVNEWKGPHGKLYYIHMELDNGDKINLGKKKPDAFKIGDTVNYEENGEGKWKEVKDVPAPKKNFEGNNKAAMVGMALKIAFSSYYDKNEENFNETVALAQRIVDVAEEMMKEDTTEEKSDDNGNLPF